MGNSVSSTNIANTVINQTQTFVAEVFNSAQASASQLQTITIKNIVGNVKISNNVIRQTATVNVSALFDSAATVNAQEAMMTKLAQTTKAVTSGFNFATKTADRNEINNTLNAVLDITSKIQNNCFASANQVQNVDVESVQGDVTLTNNSFEQISNVMTSCIAKNTTENTAVQSAQVLVDSQSAKDSFGFDPYIPVVVIGLIGVGLLLILAGGIYTLRSKLVVPLVIAILGVIFILLYLSSRSGRMATVQYPLPISTNCPSAQFLSSSTTYATAEIASKACYANPKCACFEFIAYTTNADGTTINLVNNPPQTKFYSTAPPECESLLITNDALQITYAPKFGSGVGGPPVMIKPIIFPYIPQLTVWLDTGSTTWYIYNLTKQSWTTSGSFATLFGQTGLNACWSWDTVYPRNAATIVITTMVANPTQFSAVYNGVTKTVSGPGRVIVLPPKINVSGYKITVKNVQYLFLGVVCLILACFSVLIILRKTKAIPQATI